jgi:hypothetical protein
VRERELSVEFGPSRSKRFGKAVALAQGGPGECTEVEPGRYRVTFLLSREAALYSALGRLLERVRHWRATEVYEEEELVSSYQAKEMAWCASFQLSTFGRCRERFQFGVLPRCALCPLFDSERAIRAGIREASVPGEDIQPAFRQEDPEPIPEQYGSIVVHLDVLFDPELMAQFEWDLPEWVNLGPLVPDFPPEEWPESPADGDTI